MAKQIEETALTKKIQEDSELTQVSKEITSAQAISEVQGALILAKRFPRDEDMSYMKLLKSCKRYTFADRANYSFPRGGTTITGPSINLAREFARVWGNIEYGHVIVSDDDEERHIRAWAWDKETNTRVFEEDSFKKLVYRKKDGGQWVKPDERDLRELTNRRAAICKRNCLLQLMPRDFIDEAQYLCKETLKKKVAEDPDRAKKDIILAFSTLNITPVMLEGYLSHPIAQCSPAEIVTLREIYQSISDGNSTWSEYVNVNGKEDKSKSEGQLSLGALKNGKVNMDEETKIDASLQEWFETYNFYFDKAKENLGIKKDWKKLDLDKKKELLEEVKRISVE